MWLGPKDKSLLLLRRCLAIVRLNRDLGALKRRRFTGTDGESASAFIGLEGSERSERSSEDIDEELLHFLSCMRFVHDGDGDWSRRPCESVEAFNVCCELAVPFSPKR